MTHNDLRSSRNSSEKFQSETVSSAENLVEYVRDVHGNVTVCGGEGSSEMEKRTGKTSGNVDKKPIRGILKRTKSANAKLVNGFPQVHKDEDEFSSIDSSISPAEDNQSKYDLSVESERKLVDGETHVTNIPSDKSSTNVEVDGLETKAEKKEESVSDVDQISNIEISDSVQDAVSSAEHDPVPPTITNETELIEEESSANKNNCEKSSREITKLGKSAENTQPESKQPSEAQPPSTQGKQTDKPLKPSNKSLLSLGSTQNSSYKTPSVSFDTSLDRTPSLSRESSLEKTLSVSEPASSSGKTPPISRENSSDKTPSLSRASSVGSSETLKKWRRTGIAVKTSLKFQEAGRIAKLKQAMTKLKKESLRYINALAKDHIPEDEDPFILQHFNDRSKKKVYVGSSKPGAGEDQGAFVVDPAGDLYFFTQALVTVAMLYNIVSSILRLTFVEFEEEHKFVIFTLDSICDIIYLSDFAVKFRTGYLDDGILVTDVQKIKENYMSSQDFSYDLAAVLPLCISYGIAMEIYQHSIYFFTSRPDVEASMIKNILIGEATLRLFKLAKFYSMRRFFESFGSRTNSPGVMRAFCLIMYLLLSIHWVACIYYSVSEYEGFGVNSWVFPKYEIDDPNNTLHRKYIHCFYWAFLTLTTIGGPDQPDTTLEFVLTCVTFLLGIFIFAAVVGNVGDAITSMNESKTTYQKRSDAIKLYMQHHGVPDILQRKVKKWLEYSWMRTQGADEQSLMDALPERLRARIAIQIHVKTLKKVKIFENCEHGLLCELVLKLKPQIYSPGDYICRIGEIGKEMFIISHGKVECIITTASGERKTVAVLVAGQSFGEIALLGVEGCSRRTADVRAIGYSELLSLSKKALTQALEDYPEARKQLEQEGKNRLGKGSSTNSNNVKEESEDVATGSPQINELLSQLKNFDSLMYKEKMAALTAEKEALQLELETKTKELEEAQRLILEYTDNRTRLK
ncbi:hypothetical protein ACHWQZ_G013486 [Mnemiopsis leidyi]